MKVLIRYFASLSLTKFWHKKKRINKGFIVIHTLSDADNMKVSTGIFFLIFKYELRG